MNNNEIKHFGVLGMRWGRRSGNIPSSSGRSKGGLNVFGTKRLSYEEREQKRRDVTKKLIGVALAAIGAKLYEKANPMVNAYLDTNLVKNLHIPQI